MAHLMVTFSTTSSYYPQMLSLQHLFNSCQVCPSLAVESPALLLKGIYSPDNQLTDLRITWVSLGDFPDANLSQLVPEEVLSSLCARLAQGSRACLAIDNPSLPRRCWYFAPYKEGYLATLLPDSSVIHRERVHPTGNEDVLRQQNEELEKQVDQQANEIQHLKALLKAIVNDTALGFAATDTQGVIQLVNPALEVITGYQAYELIGKVSSGALRAPQTRQGLIQTLTSSPKEQELEEDALVVKNRTFLPRENTLLHKEGHQVPVLSTVSGLYDEQGALLGYADFVTDISELIQTQKTAEQASQRLRFVTETAGLGLWEFDLTTRTVRLDDQLHRICGTDPTSLLLDADLFNNLIHPDDRERFQQATLDTLENKPNTDFLIRLIRPDGELIELGMRMQPLLDEHRQPFQLIGLVYNRTLHLQRQTTFVHQQTDRYRDVKAV